MKIAVGLSGGVDSAVAAYLLKKEGHEIFGTIMTLWKGGDAKTTKGNACYGPDEKDDIEEAKKVCDFLEIPFKQIDCSKEYESIVLDNFNREYTEGRTPNPCILCNKNIKFGALPALLFKSGMKFEKFATGHYVNAIEDAGTGNFILKKGKDPKKDQSYFLYRLTQEQLSRSLFPLGNYTKDEVRKIAKDSGLPVYNKPESQDFYSGNYSDLIKSKPKKGSFLNLDGEVLGEHNGIWNYTIGQRKGLGISGPHPLYVIAISAKTNNIILGRREELFSKGLRSEDVNILVDMLPEKAKAKIRSSAEEKDCLIEITKTGMDIIFDEEQSSVTPGQSVVLYDGDTVLGGGIIKSAIK